MFDSEPNLWKTRRCCCMKMTSDYTPSSHDKSAWVQPFQWLPSWRSREVPKHSSTPLTRSTLLLDTFPKKELLNCSSHFCFALSIIVVLLIAFLFFFFLALSVCVCACVHVCKCISVHVWPVIRLLFWSLCHFNKCFYVIRLKFSLPPYHFLLFSSLSLSFLFLCSSIGLYPSALRSFFFKLLVFCSNFIFFLFPEIMLQQSVIGMRAHYIF